MEGSIRTASASARKLLEGERVEVRQKERGLRGSWHAGVVVRVKFCRRVVEYDELFTLDGLKKLRELIPLNENVKFRTSVSREKNGTQGHQNSRGFIRPVPPPCLLPFPQCWTKGLLVDAFHEDAWWEGILLEDVLSDNVNAKIRILFPEEGDELKILVRNVRVSQEWDEATGQWAVSGHWSDETGDFSSLKQIWRHRSCTLKNLWRQRRCNGTEGSCNVEQSNTFLAPISESKILSCSGNAVLERGADVDLDMAVPVEVEHSAVLEVQSSERNCQDLTGPQSAVTDAKRNKGQVSMAQNASSFTVGSSDNEQCVIEKGQQETPISQSKSATVIVKEMSNSLPRFPRSLVSSNIRVDESDAKAKETVCEQYLEELPKQQPYSCPKQGIPNTRTVAKAMLKRMAKAEGRLTRSRMSLEALHGVSSKKSGSSGPLKQNLQHAIAADKLASCADAGSAECSMDDSKTEKRKGNASVSSDSDTLLTEHRTCQQGIIEVPKNNASDGEDLSLRKAKALLTQARLSAKRFLLDAGWRIEFRVHSTSLRQEAVYTSPTGSRYGSLASACRGLQKCQNLSICSGDNSSKELELLNTYNIAKGFACLQKTLPRPMKGGKMVSSDRLRKPKSVSRSIVKEGKLHPTLQNGLDISCQRSHTMVKKEEAGLESSPSVADGSSAQELRHDQSQLALCAGKAGKRKQNGKDSVCSPEPKCKKSKSSLKKAGLVQDKGSRAGCRMQVLLSLPGRADACSAPDSAEPSHFKRSTVLSWLIDKGVLKENEAVSYLSRKNGHPIKKGRVTREGVRCNCCKVVFTLSNFEAHAGSKLHRPSANIFLNDGRSISECQMQACALQDAKEKKEALMDSSDDTCGVCGDGGELILCDHCPSTFHPDCIGLKVIPEGDWYCPRCCCGACGGNQLSGVEDTRMHRCAQCELEYHLACVHAHGVLKSERVSRKTWFCRPQCEEIFTALRGLVGITHPLEKGLCWMLLRSMNRDHGITPSSLEVMAEYNSKLSVAHGVMQECFVPMIDPRTKINLISQALYNRRSKVARLNYTGFYTMVLERGDEIISVATIRIHGAKLAEMPLVGTRFQYRRQGMCRRLVHALEEMLRNVGVEKLILPAVPELLDTWKGSFRYQELSFLEKCELIKLNLMSFPGTTLLHKHLLADPHAKERPPCQLVVSGRIDNLDSASCKCEKDFKSGAGASPVQGVPNLEMFTADQSQASAEGATCCKTSLMEKREPLVQNLHSCLGIVEHLQGESQPISQDLQGSRAAVEITEGHVNESKGRLKGRIKCKPLVESVDDALILGEECQEDDGYNTKVVLTTTRSKRLVKSCRWVVDGLKELAKDAKQSKRALSIESSIPKSPEGTQELKYTHFAEEYSQSEDGQGNGQMIGNVYIRTRRRAAPLLVHVDDGKELQRVVDISGNDCVSERPVEYHLSESGKHSDDESNSASSNRKLNPLSRNGSNLGTDIRYEIGLADAALNISSIFGGVGSVTSQTSSDLKNCNDGSMQPAENGMLMDTKYYSRRKKRERHEDTKAINAKEDMEAITLQTSGPSTLLHPSFGLEPQELSTEVIVSQNYGGEGQNRKVASNVFKPAPSLCTIASLVPVAIDRQGVRG